MRTTEEETQEDNIGHIGKDVTDGVPLGGTATESSMDPSLSPAEERPENNYLAQHIGSGIKTT